jgi:hypothetical protein
VARAKAATTRVIHAPAKKKAKRQQAREQDDPLERVLARVSAEPPPAQASEPQSRPRKKTVPGLRTARLVTAANRAAEILFRGERAPVVAAVADEVEADVLATAAANRDSVLVEVVEDAPPLIVGVVQTRSPRSIRLKGATVEIEAEREILLKTGRGALRIREDGDIELVGSRVVAMSRGLFRLVGKMLRLN